ncbi:carbohydrate porin [Singulisphaera sp. GP187]|uniref:carbohydrate porin n=1 Tax=Singulisphaera sp. GP187 TaxID=1882752 RepID=UPI0020B11A41|nr:carbohydrate porin [Singulisphaera sp. GP187]
MRLLTTAVLLGGMFLSGSTFGQEVEPDAVVAPSLLDRPAGSGVSSNFDVGQETPRPPITPPPVPDPYPDGPRSSRFLLGDAFGLRSSWEERGVSFYVSSTQFEQGVTTGGFRQAFRWGSKFDMLAHLDSGKLGLWEGGAFDLFVESRLGQSVDGFAGAFSPTNLAMFFPVSDAQITAITGLKFTQAITERSGIFFGKLNALNGDREKFLSYPLTSRFWNAAFNFNLTLDRYPYSAPGAGFYVVPERGPALAFLALDSYDSPRTSGFENLGRNGLFLYAEATQSTAFFGLPGRQILAGLYGTGSFADLAPASFIELPHGAASAPEKAGTWTLLWNIEQRLWVNPDAPDRGLGLYVQTGLGDGNPNPIRWFLSVALCGNSPLPGREGDLFGVGFYDLGLSEQAKRQMPGLRDEPGVELFYNMRLAPGCHLTPDLQVIQPGLAPVDPALLLGVRLKLDF